jgi:exonuclease SbcC
MRPRRLVLDGFLAYQQRTEVDFTDADLFVLSGPIGAGKSSVIEGMIFALYGAIPRLDHKGSVAPVISVRADTAKVAFEFSVGEETFVAARLVERNKSGASTTEATLERADGGEVLARGPDEVTSRVTELLGLTYDQFTKAVVLPQGTVTDFLKDKPSDRQGLLRALLDIGLFERVMQLANARAKTAEGRAQAMEESLAKLDVPTPEQLKDSRAQLKAILAARKELPSRAQALERFEVALEAAKTSRAEGGLSLNRLESIAMPDDLTTIEQDRAEVFGHLETFAQSVIALSGERDGLDLALDGHASLSQLESWRAGRAQIEQLAAHKTTLDIDGLATTLVEATAARDRGRADLEAVRIEHANHAVRQGLVVGQPCPVCEAVIGELPKRGEGPGESIERLSHELAALEARVAEVRDRLKAAEGEANGIHRQVSEIEAGLVEAPNAEEVDSSIAVVRSLVERRAGIEQELSVTRQKEGEARARADELATRASGLVEALLAARDVLAAEKPPIPGDDPIQAWQLFESWRIGEIESRNTDLERLGEVVKVAEADLNLASAEMRAWLDGLGVESAGSPEAHLLLAEERRRAEIVELEKSIADAADIGLQLKAETARARVASALGIHLKSNNFEAWLLEEAMEALVDGANLLLSELTGGAYSLLASRSQFEVIDHRNADLRRTTRGLSGGETFLVALSLSLSMAEQLAELTGSSSRLECVLLDEGFGSLDQESIDIVASVLDELASGGRTVGIVTHVQELSERIPVRFEVTKGAETSSVERISL